MTNFLEEQLSFFLAQIPGDVFIKNREGTYLACSDSFARKAGFANAALVVGKTDHDCVWKAYAAAFLANDQRIIETGETEQFHEAAQICDDNFETKITLVRAQKSPLKHPSGEIIGVIGILTELPESVEVDNVSCEKLREKETIHQAEVAYLIDWYRSLSGQTCPPTMTCQQIGDKIRHYLNYVMDRLPVNIFWVDTEGVILGYNTNLENMCNDQWSFLYPLQRNTFRQGQRLEDLLPPEHLAEVLNNNAMVFAGDSTMVFEESLPAQDGSERIVLAYKTPIFDDEHKKIGLVGVSVDITERKRAEKSLREAKEKAEEAHLAKVQFLKNMRHDVRTPLSCITASIKILKKIEDDPEKLEFLNGVLYSGENLLKMLTTMLEYDHIQLNERPVQYQSLKIRGLLRDLMEMFGFTARQKGLKLYHHVGEEVPEDLFTDFYRLQRVLMNLINNALKFTHAGHVQVSLTMQGENLLCCEISDTGIGIEESKQRSIFEKYVRVVRADQGQYQGEGLGLSIVKQFVEEIGGKIEVESKLNQGSRFTVLLDVRFVPRGMRVLKGGAYT